MEPDISADLVEKCLTSTYFIWYGPFYQQISGKSTGTPLLLIVNWFHDVDSSDTLTTFLSPPFSTFWYKIYN